MAWRTAFALAAVFLAYSLLSATAGLAVFVAGLLPTTAASAAAHVHQFSAILRVLPDPVVLFLVAFALLPSPAASSSPLN